MKRLILGITVALFAATAYAQTPTSELKGDRQITIAQATAVPVQSPAGTQTTVQTTAPVDSKTVISVGTLAGEVLTWIASAFSLLIGTIGSLWLTKFLKKLGVETTGQMQSQLQNIIVNGINSSAANITNQLKDKGNVEIKNKVVADTVAYVQDHAAETIKALGLDPKSGEAVTAIKARIETALIDPTTPTNNIVVPNAYIEPTVAGVPVQGQKA